MHHLTNLLVQSHNLPFEIQSMSVKGEMIKGRRDGLEALECVGLAGILGLMGAFYRQPARITYAVLPMAHGQEKGKIS